MPLGAGQMAICIGRREFVAALGGASLAWPLAARAQQPALPVIGFLRSTSLAPFQSLVVAFGEGLKEAGFVDGQNVKIEYRYADNQRDRVPALVAELIRLPVAVLAVNSGAVAAAKAATTTIPIVFAAGADPVKDGLVASLNRPGGNITGVSWLGAQVGAKRLELLRQIVPKTTTIGMLEDLSSPGTEAERADEQGAGRGPGDRSATHHYRRQQRPRHRDGHRLLRSTRGWRAAGRRRRIPDLEAGKCRRTSGAPCHPGDVRGARGSRGRRADELWAEPERGLPPGQHLCRADSQG